jgi:hypothetical protein
MLAPHAPQPDDASPGARHKRTGALSPSKSASNLLHGKTDLLLRFFGSSHFNEWIAVHYLWRAKSEVRAGAAWVARGGPASVVPDSLKWSLRQGVRDYLCNRMYSLDERLLEAHLGQLVTLAVTQPSPSLDRLLVDLCRRSPRVACKVRHPAQGAAPAPRRGGASSHSKQEPRSPMCCGSPWRLALTRGLDCAPTGVLAPQLPARPRQSRPRQRSQ